MSWDDFLKGALTMGALVIALYFLRFWRVTGDRLFLLFSIAFAMLGCNWLFSAGRGGIVEHAHLFRFAAFALIAGAVINKNRANARKQS